MDSRRNCWCLPVGHHDRSFLGSYCKQFDQGSHGFWILPRPNCRAISLGYHPGRRVSVFYACIEYTLTVFSLFFLPETPRYLIKMDRYDEAAKSLGKLRRLPVDHPAVLEELNEVQANHLYEMSLGKSTYADTLKGTLGKRLLTGCLLQSLQQLTGVNFICK